MHVLILNQTFHPDVAATAQLMWDLARHLAGNGHRVSVITSRNVYGTVRRHELGHQRVGNIHIHRVGGTARGKASLLARMSDFVSFYVAAFAQLRRIATPDVILALTSPPMIALLGVLERQFVLRADGRRIRLAYHIMDLYPDAAVAMGVMRVGSVLHRLMARLTRRTLEASDAVIVLGRDMAERVVAEYGNARLRRRICVVPPWADGYELRPLEKAQVGMARALGLQGTFNVVYSGNLGMAHDVETIAQAIELTRDDASMWWLFIGGGARFDALKRRAAEAGWQHVRFLPYQQREDLIQSLNLADVHLVSQLPAFGGLVVPSKLYGIMAVGKPVVMIGPADTECARVIAETGCGHVVGNGQAAELARCLRRLRDAAAERREMGDRARRAFEVRYDRAIACARIERILAGSADGGFPCDC